MEALAAGGFTELVVNTDWLGAQISARFGAKPLLDGHSALSISYSDEGRDFGGALETAGGIVRALPLLGDVFWVAAGDVFAPGFAFTQASVERFVASGRLAHLWLVPNPAHNLKGDFGLSADGLALNTGREVHLLDHRPVPGRALRTALLRHPERQPGRPQSPAGADTARRDGQ